MGDRERNAGQRGRVRGQMWEGGEMEDVSVAFHSNSTRWTGGGHAAKVKSGFELKGVLTA